MIIKASTFDHETLKERLLEMTNDDNWDISRATDEEIQAGIATLSQDVDLNRELINRAVEKIRQTMSENRYN